MKSEEIEALFTYHAPTADSLRGLVEVRSAAKTLALVINDNVPDCADKSAAIRLLREAVMTANAGIVLNQFVVRSNVKPCINCGKIFNEHSLSGQCLDKVMPEDVTFFTLKSN